MKEAGKKSGVITAAIAALFLWGTSGESAMGDVNGDGAVDAADASMVLSEYAKGSVQQDTEFSDEQKQKADVTGDGVMDAADASAIISYYAYSSTEKAFLSADIYFENLGKL